MIPMGQIRLRILASCAVGRYRVEADVGEEILCRARPIPEKPNGAKVCHELPQFAGCT